MKLILCSQSPRRLELLESAGVHPEVRVPDVDETTDGELTPADTVRTLAQRKVSAGARGAAPGEYLLAADTVVAAGNEILGKPADEADARRMLHMLSGTRHFVLTGAAVSHGGRTECGVCETAVTFRPLTDAEIDDYIATGEPFGKAGSYAIQEAGGGFVLKTEGEWDNVVGLPLALTDSLLSRFGVHLADFE